MGEFNVYGIYVPALLVQAIFAYIFSLVKSLNQQMDCTRLDCITQYFQFVFLPFTTFGDTPNFCWVRCLKMIARLKIELGE